MVKWDREEIFNSGDIYFSRLIDEIGRAKESVDLETYIYEDDELGHRITDALQKAAARGVRVRAMADGIGSPNWCSKFIPQLLHGKVQARVFHPPPWLLLLEPIRRHVSFSHFVKLARFINRRNHRKICIIDGKSAWVGSMNITSQHLTSECGHKAWRDTGVRVEGDGIGDLLQAFNRAWDEAWDFRQPTVIRSARMLKRPRRTKVNGLVRINNTWRGRRRLYRDLLTRIDGAKSRIWITSAYFVPSTSIVRALSRAARRKVDVRLLVPRESDVFFIHWVSSAFYYVLLKAGVRIFEYLPSVLHAKILAIDDWVVIGSSNMNYRSLVHDLEADIVMTKPLAKKKLKSQFRKDLKNTSEVTLRDWHGQSEFEKWAGKNLLRLRYWM